MIFHGENMWILLIILVGVTSLDCTHINYTIALIFGVGNSMFDVHSKPAVELGITAINDIVGDRLNLNMLRASIPHNAIGCGINGVEVLAAKLYHIDKIDGFVGPECSRPVRALAQMASDWGLPMFTPLGISSINADKQTLKTLTRLGYINVKFVKIFYAILDHFNWTDLSFVYSKGQYLQELFKSDIVQAFADKHYRLNLIPVTVSDGTDAYTKGLLAASKVSRVLYVMMHGPDFRDFMIEASNLGMTNGEYAFVYIRQFEGDGTGEMSWLKGDDLDLIARSAYDSVLMIQFLTPHGQRYKEFERQIKMMSKRDFNYDWGTRQVDIFIVATHDVFVLYGTALVETLDAGEDPKDGQNVLKRLWGRTFEGIAGLVSVDKNGDVEVNSALLDLDPDIGMFHEVIAFIGGEDKLVTIPNIKIHWPNQNGPPPNRPTCGFRGEEPACQHHEFPVEWMIYIVLGLLLLIIVISIGFIYRKYRLEIDILSQQWKLKWEDVTLIHRKASMPSSIVLSRESYLSHTSPFRIRQTDNIGRYKGTLVIVKTFSVTNLIIDRAASLELKKLRDCNSPNLVDFYGLCLDYQPNIYLITEHCSRGSLQDLMQNDTINLSREFKMTLINDILKGMVYIHDGPLHFHGRLSSENCLIDSRFTVKLSEFWESPLSKMCCLSADVESRFVLRIAPEHLRKDHWNNISQCGDVYSFGIILFELLTRTSPYEEELNHMSLHDITNQIKSKNTPHVRPRIEVPCQETDIIILMKRCWSEEPQARPSVRGIIQELKREGWYVFQANVFDTIMNRLEQYANDLQRLVAERTVEFLHEKKKSEELLYHIIPKSVANQLKMGKTVDPEWYESVTIYFSDIVGFTSISAGSSPVQVVTLLNDLYTCFDMILENYDVYKVETIGDAYMVVSGLPIRNGDAHAEQIARMALAILAGLKQFRISHMPDVVLKARIGLHSGSVCAGVVGTKMPRYCLFGDTVNTASIMESNSKAMRIHLSGQTRDLLHTFGCFVIEKREDIDIKGKGQMTTYWLNGYSA